MIGVVVLGAGEEWLRGNVDIGEGRISGDFDAIGEDGRGGVRPGRTTVLGDVLVVDVGQVVYA